MSDPRWRRDREFGYTADVLGFSDPSFTLLRDIIAARTGIYFSESKRDLLVDKVSELVANRGMTSFLDYYYLLRYGAQSADAWAELMDRLAVPETFFWRQSEQITAVASHLVARHLERDSHEPLRIWSAACCSGEEPISLAMALGEAGWLGRVPIEIVASDGSVSLIERARRGLYSERAFRNLPARLRERYFVPEGSQWRVAPEIATQIEWHVANLMEPREVQPLADADIIFCRNVFIYFSDSAIEHVVRLFGQGLRAGGHLFLGASESLTRLDTEFELAEVGGAFVYVRRGEEQAAARRELTAAIPAHQAI